MTGVLKREKFGGSRQRTHTDRRMWVVAIGPTPTFLPELKMARGETTRLIMQQAELGLQGALLSNDNKNTFFYHPGSGEGDDIPGGIRK